MPPTNITLENDISLLNEKEAEKTTDLESKKLESNILDLSAKVASAFLAEKNKNNKTRACPSSTFGDILTQLTKFVTLSPKNPEAERQLVQNRKILDVLQNKYYSLLRAKNAPISAHQQKVMGEVAKKIGSWVESISREADRKLVENRTLRVIVEEAAAEVEAQTAFLNKPQKPEARKPILRTQSDIVPPGKAVSRDISMSINSAVSTDTGISNVDDVYDWANWMVDAMATAEEWRSWIQKTVEETKSMNDNLKPASQTDWSQWKNNVADEAIKLIKRKKDIQDTAPSWAKDCCESMVARDFALNSVTTRCRSSSPVSGIRVKTLEEEQPKKRINSAVKSWTRPSVAAQNASVRRLSGQNFETPTRKADSPSQKKSSRQNLVPPITSSLPVTTIKPSKQNETSLPRDASGMTARTPSRQNLAAPQRNASSIADKQNVRTICPNTKGASPIASPPHNRNPSPITARQSIPGNTRNPSPPTKKLQPKPNETKTASTANQPLSHPKKPEAANVSPISRLTVRPKDNERRSIYATDYSKRKPVVSKNIKPVAAPKASSMSNPTGSFCFEPPPMARRPRSPFSVPQAKCPPNIREGKPHGNGFPGKPGSQSPRKNSPQRDIEVKITSKMNPNGKEVNEKGAAVMSRFGAPKVGVKNKQEAVATNGAAKRLRK